MTERLWEGPELAEIFAQSAFASGTPGVTGISIDTRSLQPGELFVALKDIRDGHEFVAAAAEAGAAAALVSEKVDVDIAQLRVPDTLEGLWQLGRAARFRIPGKTVAITGSSGKTTLRSWSEQVLRAVDHTHASVGSYNNHWGVPLSLARAPRDTVFGIFEVGTNAPGEIAPLSDLVKPHVSLLLNVLPAHIGNFPSMAALEQEKLSIADGLVDGGTFVLPQRMRDMTSVEKRLTFGFDTAADVHLMGEQSTATALHQLDIATPAGDVRLRVPFTSREHIETTLALVAMLHALGVDPMLAASNFEQLNLPTGRGNFNQVNGVAVVDDSYNANPVSMKMALTNLRQIPDGGRRIALLGEMLELGGLSGAAHAEVLGAAEGIDEVWTFGEGFKHAAAERGCHHLPDVTFFNLAEFVAGLSPGDTVLVKGSNKVFWKHDFVGKLLALLEANQS